MRQRREGRGGVGRAGLNEGGASVGPNDVSDV